MLVKIICRHKTTCNCLQANVIEPLYEQLTSIRILGLTAFQWLVIVVVWLGLSLAFLVGRFVLRSQLQRLTRRTKVSLDDALVKLLARTKTWFLLAGALYSALIVADAVPGAIRSMRAIFVVLAAIQVMIWGNALIDFYVRRYRERHIEDDASARSEEHTSELQSRGHLV